MSANGKLERDLARFTPAQRAELRDAFARSRLEAQQESARLARMGQERKAAERAEKRAAEGKPRKRRRKPEPLRPKSEPMPEATDEEAALAARLSPHVCAESVIDRKRHALNVARTLLSLGYVPAPRKEATDG